MSEILEKTEKNLRDLIETLRDGHQGFIELEKNLKDPEARKLFREETLVRAGFAAELENELHHFGAKDVKVASSTPGKGHPAWGELKARPGGGAHGRPGWAVVTTRFWLLRRRARMRPSMPMRKHSPARISLCRCGRFY